MKIFGIIFGMWLLFLMASASASDMDCFRLENTRAGHKQAKGTEKIKAYKALKSLNLLCNQSK